jgi:hypothetical protein
MNACGENMILNLHKSTQKIIRSLKNIQLIIKKQRWKKAQCLVYQVDIQWIGYYYEVIDFWKRNVGGEIS